MGAPHGNKQRDFDSVPTDMVPETSIDGFNQPPPTTKMSMSDTNPEFMAFNNILYDVCDGVCTITMKRAEDSKGSRKANALTKDMMHEMALAFHYAETDPTVKVVVLRSGLEPQEEFDETRKESMNKVTFCAGLDIGEMRAAMSVPDRAGREAAVRELIAPWRQLYEMMDSCSSTKPIIGVVEGNAAGAGVTLLTLCNHVIAAEKEAGFSYPEYHFKQFPSMSAPPLIRCVMAKEEVEIARQLAESGHTSKLKLDYTNPLVQARARRETERKVAFILQQDKPFSARIARKYNIVDQHPEMRNVNNELDKLCTRYIESMGSWEIPIAGLAETEPDESSAALARITDQVSRNISRAIPIQEMNTAVEQMVQGMTADGAAQALDEYIARRKQITRKPPPLPTETPAPTVDVNTVQPEARRAAPPANGGNDTTDGPNR